MITQNILDSLKEKYNNKCNFCGNGLSIKKCNISCIICRGSSKRTHFFFEIYKEVNETIFLLSIKSYDETIGVKISKENNVTRFVSFSKHEIEYDFLLSEDINFDPILSVNQINKIVDNLIFY